MKIGSSYDGVLYATRGLTVGVWGPQNGFEPRGTLPNPDIPFTGRQRVNFGPLNRRWAKRLLSPVTGWYTTTNIWPIDDETVLATVGHRLFRSVDGGETWNQVYELPLASGPMGTLPTSVCTHDERVFLGEYTFGDEPARVLVSDDDGRTWSPYFEQECYRHFHGVFRDPYADRLWGTTGDTDAESAIGQFDDGSFREVGKGSQRWRTVGVAFTPDAVLWGMDCSYADRIRILRLSRDELRTANPQPETVHVVDSSVFYLETSMVDDTCWVIVSTAAEPGLDSTASPGEENSCSRSTRVLAASSRTGYRTWYELFSFERRRTLGEYVSALPIASAYTYLETGDEFGLAVNPFNVEDSHGEVLTVPPEWFVERGRLEEADDTGDQAFTETAENERAVSDGREQPVAQSANWDREVV